MHFSFVWERDLRCLVIRNDQGRQCLLFILVYLHWFIIHIIHINLHVSMVSGHDNWVDITLFSRLMVLMASLNWFISVLATDANCWNSSRKHVRIVINIRIVTKSKSCSASLLELNNEFNRQKDGIYQLMTHESVKYVITVHNFNDETSTQFTTFVNFMRH